VSKDSQGLTTESSSQTFTTASKPGKPINLRAFAAMVWEALRELLDLIF
jgi:hypothetical protein